MHVAFGSGTHNFNMASVEYQTTNIEDCSLIFEVIPNYLKFVRIAIPLGLCCIQEFTIQPILCYVFKSRFKSRSTDNNYNDSTSSS